MGHSIGDGIIVAALSALLFGFLYLRYRARIKRLELVHQERLVAMEKDFPLPELPIEPPRMAREPNPHIPLILGIVLITFGIGAMIAIGFSVEPEYQNLWVTPVPLVLVGLGLTVVHRLIRPDGAK